MDMDSDLLEQTACVCVTKQKVYIIETKQINEDYGLLCRDVCETQRWLPGHISITKHIKATRREC